MARLEERIRKLEQASTNVVLEAMTDEELRDYAGKHWVAPPWGSHESTAAILTIVGRKPSKLPVVPDQLLPPDEEGWPAMSPFPKGAPDEVT